MASKKKVAGSAVRRKVGSPGAATKIERLLKRARTLGVKTGFVMPIDEIRLGYELAKQPRRSAIPKLLDLAEDKNMHARRVAFSALHHLKAWDDPPVLELFVRGLRDPEGWVRYDAAWALGDSGTGDKGALSGLKKLARSATDKPDLSDGGARAAFQAAESLLKLRTSASQRNE
jgi:HEAT repeat protein